MKKYSNAELQIVRMNIVDIVTASRVTVGDAYTEGNYQGDAPGRRRSIWN